MDWTFVKLGRRKFSIHIMTSMLPSRFVYILAAYIVAVKENETGETIANTNDSLIAFS
jgi:hypothetical protein